MFPSFNIDRNINKFAFFQMQGFGDFVILCNCLKKYTIVNQNNSIIMGSYLYSLFKELDLDIEHIIFHFSGNDIPPFYNLRKDGIIKGFLNGLHIRFLIKKNFNKKNFSIIFDNGQVNYWGLREKLLSINLPNIFMDGKENVYLSYINFFKNIGNFKHTSIINKKHITNKNLVIFPSSRQERKRIPEHILSLLIEFTKHYGLVPKIYTIEGEGSFSKKISKFHITLPRSFSSVIKIIKNSKLLISSDSLTAHIGEYYDIPTFVLSPTENVYWLPLNTFRNSYWSVFNSFHSNSKSLENFLKIHTCK